MKVGSIECIEPYGGDLRGHAPRTDPDLGTPNTFFDYVRVYAIDPKESIKIVRK